MKTIVSTGALVSLEKLNNGYQFIQQLYDKIIVPTKVIEELAFKHSSVEEYLERFHIKEFIEIHNGSVNMVLLIRIFKEFLYYMKENNKLFH